MRRDGAGNDGLGSYGGRANKVVSERRFFVAKVVCIVRMAAGWNGGLPGTEGHGSVDFWVFVIGASVGMGVWYISSWWVGKGLVVMGGIGKFEVVSGW